MSSSGEGSLGTCEPISRSAYRVVDSSGTTRWCVHGPSPRVPPQPAAILGRGAGSVGAVRCDQVDPLTRQMVIERIAVVGLVANGAVGRHAGEHELEEPLHQLRLVGCRRGAVHRHGQSACIHKHHDFHAFSGLCDAHAVTATLGFAERRIDEAFIQPVPAAFLDHAAGFAHERLEHARVHPGREPAMHGALGAELPGEVLPLRAVVENPEDAAPHRVCSSPVARPWARPTHQESARTTSQPSVHESQLPDPYAPSAQRFQGFGIGSRQAAKAAAATGQDHAAPPLEGGQHLATLLTVNIRDHWRPDAAWLSGFQKIQLAHLVAELKGTVHAPAPEKKKSELVEMLDKLFADAATGKLEDKQLTARVNSWLPLILRNGKKDTTQPKKC